MNLKKKLYSFPVWCLEKIIVPIVVRIGEVTNLNLGEESNTQF